MSDCLPCKEIINNGIIIGPALVLEGLTTGDLRDAAGALAASARALSEMYDRAVDFGVVDPVDTSGWNGCEETKELIGWVKIIRAKGEQRSPFSDGQDSRSRIIHVMRKWSADMDDIMMTLASGRLNAS